MRFPFLPSLHRAPCCRGGLALLLLGGLSACPADDTDDTTTGAGDSTTSTSSPFGDALYHIELYDDEARWVIALGDETNEFFPGLYNKFDWHWEGDALYYCTAVYDAASAEEAMAAPDADPGDLITGCGGFPWSALSPAR